MDGRGTDITTNAPVKTSYGYTNRGHDEESGLMYYRARYYEPQIGRFLSEDPDAGKIKAPISFTTKYTYVENSPINYTDPWGLYALDLGGTINGVIDRTFDFASSSLGKFGVHVSSADLARGTIIVGSTALALGTGNPYAVGAAISNTLALAGDFGKGGSASDVFNQSLNITVATAVGIFVGAPTLGGSLLGGATAFGAGKLLGLSNKDALAAGVGATGGIHCKNANCTYDGVKKKYNDFFGGGASFNKSSGGGRDFIPSI